MPSRIDASQIPASPDLNFESNLWANAVTVIAGIDEAGRGAWAGPVVAGAVVLLNTPEIMEQLNGVRDSKQLSPENRALMAEKIKHFALSWAIGFSDNLMIDEIGILAANKRAMQQAICGLSLEPDHLLLDALFLPEVETPQTALIKGDQRSLSIAAASILAKTARDEWMIQAHAEFPAYGFDQHKGYGTKRHQKALSEFGICALHRRCYRPIREILKTC